MVYSVYSQRCLSITRLFLCSFAAIPPLQQWEVQPKIINVVWSSLVWSVSHSQLIQRNAFWTRFLFFLIRTHVPNAFSKITNAFARTMDEILFNINNSMFEMPRDKPVKRKRRRLLEIDIQQLTVDVNHSTVIFWTAYVLIIVKMINGLIFCLVLQSLSERTWKRSNESRIRNSVDCVAVC